MEKLIILKGDKPVNEFPLSHQKVTIGRGNETDLQLDDPAISRIHCQLIKVFNNYFLEDLKSTNGTQLNSSVVTKHILKHEDNIQLGDYTLRYINSEAIPDIAEEEEDDLDKTVILKTPVRPVTPAPAVVRKISPKTAVVRFFKGPKQGKSDKIDRSLYTIGRPGGQVAAIARRPQGFYLLHIGGDDYPKINNKIVDSNRGVQLQEGDVVEVGENLAEISF